MNLNAFYYNCHWHFRTGPVMMRRMKLKMKPCIISTVPSRTVLWPLKTRVTFLVLPQHRSCWSRATEHSLGWLRTRTHSIGDPRNISSVHHCRHIQLLMSQNCGELIWGWHYVKLAFFESCHLSLALWIFSYFWIFWVFLCFFSFLSHTLFLYPWRLNLTSFATGKLSVAAEAVSSWVNGQWWERQCGS